MMKTCCDRTTEQTFQPTAQFSHLPAKTSGTHSICERHIEIYFARKFRTALGRSTSERPADSLVHIQSNRNHKFIRRKCAYGELLSLMNRISVVLRRQISKGVGDASEETNKETRTSAAMVWQLLPTKLIGPLALRLFRFIISSRP